ncbi:MAG: hypothetical protein JXA30_11810 [Deltaproteobacteria bacterium]|nr:hypothetical protein [Deltaproteobacteria bacterium]
MQSFKRHCKLANPALLTDRAGLSTMEYAVLFVVIVVGALAAWGALGGDLARFIDQGRIEYRDHLTIEKEG